MILEIVMAVVMLFLIYSVFVSYQYANLLRKGLILAELDGIKSRITTPSFIDYTNKAIKEHRICLIYWLPFVIGATTNITWVWWSLSQGDAVNSVCLTVTALWVSGVITVMHQKEFVGRWLREWNNQLVQARSEMMLDLLEERWNLLNARIRDLTVDNTTMEEVMQLTHERDMIRLSWNALKQLQEDKPN